MALLQNPAQEPVVTSSSQNFWWQTEYSILVKRVTDAADSSLSTSYRTGPAGRGRVRLQLTKTQDDGLVLTIELPREAISSIDEKTGESIPSETTLQTTIRDHNLDGLPDDFKIEPAGKPIYEEDFTEDEFIKYRDSNDHQAILIQWSIAIGYLTNHFIHGIDSAMPRI